MRTEFLLLIALFMTAPPGLEAEEPVVTFARSGKPVAVPLVEKGPLPSEVVLHAFDRVWGNPARVKDGMVELNPPTVRTPITFRLVPRSDSTHTLAILVVYPEQFRVGSNDLRVVASGAPAWFQQWCQAVGLPLKQLPRPSENATDVPADKGRQSVLVIGREKAGRGPVALRALAARYEINVLALDADWFGKGSAASIAPAQMQGPLADMQGQSWPLPPVFDQSRTPWLGIVNRRAWIAGTRYPLAEELFLDSAKADARRIVLSYLPWQEQLGQREIADVLFLRLLTEAAKAPAARKQPKSKLHLLYPDPRYVTEKRRPVLAAALRCDASLPIAGSLFDLPPKNEGRDDGRLVYVLDLRGNRAPRRELLEGDRSLKGVEPLVSKSTPLLILGDDVLLDRWMWLKIDRPKRRSLRPGVVWLPGDALPSSPESQIRLMQVLTDWNIPLSKRYLETNHE